MLRILFLLSLFCIPIEVFANDEPIDLKKLELKKEGPFFIFYFNDKPYTGKAVKFHENGNKMYEGSMKDGKDHGTATRWYKEGQKRSQTTLNEGRLDGTVTEWYKTGEKKWEGNYQNGEKNGMVTKWHESGQKSREEVYMNGTLVSSKDWSETGELTNESNF